jgi:hypothetical protein
VSSGSPKYFPGTRVFAHNQCFFGNPHLRTGVVWIPAIDSRSNRSFAQQHSKWITSGCPLRHDRNHSRRKKTCQPLLTVARRPMGVIPV